MNALTQARDDFDAPREIPSEAGQPWADSKPWLRAMAQASGEYLALVDMGLRIVVASRGIGQRSAQELDGVPLVDILPAHAHAGALNCLRTVLASGQPGRFVLEVNAPGGGARHFEVRACAVRHRGEVMAVSLSATETTEQVRAQRAILTQARMIESMLEGVALVNAAGVVEITNPAFDALFAYARGELIGRELTDLIGTQAGQHDRWQSTIAEARRRRRSAALEFQARRRDGTQFAAAGVLSWFEVAGREQWLVVLQDVTERKELERALLEAVNREQYRIGNDLHDGLGQELTGIALMLRGVAGRLTAEYPAMLPEVESITRLVSNAVESTRALARGLSPVNLERGGLSDALEGLCMHARDLYGVNVVFTHRLRSSLQLLPELANHLYRIAQEALTNAVRHGQARVVRIHLSALSRRIRLSIDDDGLGIADESQRGAGMGMRIMEYRARMAGGEVRVERTEPRGTRVVCECPIAVGRSPRRSASRRSRGERALQSATGAAESIDDGRAVD